MAEPIRIRARWHDGLTEVHLLMPHPMDTGLSRDESGRLIAAHYITDMRVSVSGRTVLAARMSIAVSKDPLLSFRFRGARIGEPISVSWIDNGGERRIDESLIS